MTCDNEVQRAGVFIGISAYISGMCSLLCVQAHTGLSTALKEEVSAPCTGVQGIESCRRGGQRSWAWRMHRRQVQMRESRMCWPRRKDDKSKGRIQ